MAPPPSSKKHKDLPDHLFHTKILPRLPFKYLNRLKCISRELHSLISTDAKFAVDQSRSADTSSSDFVYMSDGILSFFPDQPLIGVPDPSLKFLPTTHYRKLKLISCTNGLLLLQGQCSRDLSLCVCNPATKEMVFIPEMDGWEKYSYCEMGLAYDPHELPDQFTIVEPLMYDHGDGFLYQFNVFRSNTGKWTCSSQRVYVDKYNVACKSVCAKGVIYWCGDLNYLLWYDTKRDLAGFVVLPTTERRIHVGVYAGEITLCGTCIGGINVWRLTRGSYWDRLHVISWDRMLDVFNKFFCRHMYIIFPVGFDGQFVYIAVWLNCMACLNCRHSTLRLFRWETETGRIEDKGPINIGHRWYETRIFKYANSMARVPQIMNGTS